MDILDEIVAHKHQELEHFKAELPPSILYNKVETLLESGSTCPSMHDSIMRNDKGIIAEFKRRSPSKGWIKQDARPDIIPLQYEKNGAAAISILTDEKYFGGADEYIRIARRSGVTLPILYKNFIVDEYQLFQARECGASAVLLIAACLSKDECRTLLHTAHELGMEALLEMHSEPELEYADLQPDMCGINNRNLGSFVTDVQNSFRLVDSMPKDACKVSESGIKSEETIQQLRDAGFNGFLIGEWMMQR